jgi:hypothetical protein
MPAHHRCSKAHPVHLADPAADLIVELTVLGPEGGSVAGQEALAARLSADAQGGRDMDGAAIVSPLQHDNLHSGNICGARSEQDRMSGPGARDALALPLRAAVMARAAGTLGLHTDDALAHYPSGQVRGRRPRGAARARCLPGDVQDLRLTSCADRFGQCHAAAGCRDLGTLVAGSPAGDSRAGSWRVRASRAWLDCGAAGPPRQP